ncbi:ankyrin repeat domain-containing protein [Kitasatospora sp. MMS16-BH015]|uniref:ankyrin repeat domain-containing protein n=1 Tax=Kitasatospora sp. MMS16-BH015 TaxID=2018025 RepID=UPI000CF21A32|nr:HEAT repeat domain-containing protein [Kitasatospora sp. MMS16-BH015]
MRRGDEGAVRILLEDGADPETFDEHGLPVLCLAVAAFDASVAGHLVTGGADASRRLPDGTTPLLRAVDSGSVGLVRALLDEPPSLHGSARAELLARARQWHETGAVAMLRQSTGSVEPVAPVRVRDPLWFTDYHELRLGGLTVRDGHTGVLALLERSFGLCPTVTELADRAGALEHPDHEHASWSELVETLAARHDEETWAGAAALRAHPDPVHRRFGVEVLVSLNLADLIADLPTPFERPTRELLLDWAAAGDRPEVLAELLAGLSHHEDPRIEPLGLSYLSHPSPSVRARVPSALDCTAPDHPARRTFTPAGLAALLTLAQDADAEVRAVAGYQLAESAHQEPAVADALAALLDDARQVTRIWAVSGLAQRDDPRCLAGATRIGPIADRQAWSWILDAPARYEERRRRRGGPTGSPPGRTRSGAHR